MNRWHVYEYIKSEYMYTGQLPTYKRLRYEFYSMDWEEIKEGVIEFELATGLKIRHKKQEVSA